jgi:shikimate dehydrogenase
MITGTTRIAAVIGWPVEHSRSPQMLNAAFANRGVDAVLVPMAVPPDKLGAAVAGLRAARALGASVTLPHKIAVAEECDVLSPAARAIGAVNCLHFTDDGIVGHNTDSAGFVDSLEEAGCVQPPRVVLLGAGGAARAVAYGLSSASAVEIVARDVERASWIGAMQKAARRLVATPWSELGAALARADLVVDCTPIGLSRDEQSLTDGLPIASIRREAWVVTLVYHRPTILLERAQQLGHPTLDGRGMLVHQGARAFAIWTNQPAPVAAMRHALDEALRGT